MRIPHSFQLAGVEWTVCQVQGLSDLGLTHRDIQTIELKKNQNKQSKEVAFIHELVHAIKFTMGEESHDEVHTDAFAQLLHQAITTFK